MPRRCEADAGVLGAMTGVDAGDPDTAAAETKALRDYTPFLKRAGLKGARIGVPRANFYDPVTAPGESTPRGGLNEFQAKSMADAIEVLKKEGAIVVDADIPSVVDKDPRNNFLLWGSCGGPNDVKGKDENCSYALKYGMKRDFNAWLASLGAAAPVKTLTELREFNKAHSNRNAIKYGQANLDVSDEMDLEKDRARWQADREKDIRLAATHGIDEVMKAQKLDALLFPGSNGAGIAARPGYPTVIVPFGLLTVVPPQNAPFPQGFTPKPAPFGVSFTGMACSEPRLIELAYAFEQATKRRVPPPNVP